MKFHTSFVNLIDRGFSLILLVLTLISVTTVITQAQESPGPAPRVGGGGRRGFFDQQGQERRRSTCNLKGGVFLAADERDHGAYDGCFCARRQACIQMGSGTGGCADQDPSDLTICPIGNHAVREHLRSLCAQTFPGVLAHHVTQIEIQRQRGQALIDQQSSHHRSEVVRQNSPLLAGSILGAATLGGLAYQIFSLLWTGKSCSDALTKKSSEASFSGVRLTPEFYAVRTAQILEIQKLLRTARGWTGIRLATFGIQLQPVAREYENFLRAIAPKVGSTARALGAAVGAYSAERNGAVQFLSEVESLGQVLEQQLGRLPNGDPLTVNLTRHRDEVLNASHVLRIHLNSLFYTRSDGSSPNSVPIHMTSEGQALSEARGAWTSAVDGLWMAIETQVSSRASALVDATTRGPQSNRIRGAGALMGGVALAAAATGGIAGFLLPMSHYTVAQNTAASSQQDSALQVIAQGSESAERKLELATQRIGSQDLDYLLQNYPLTGVIDSPEAACRAVVRSQLGSGASRLPLLYTQLQERAESIRATPVMAPNALPQVPADQDHNEDPRPTPLGGP